MTRYFFDIRGASYDLHIRDYEGIELPDAAAAYPVAVETAKALIAEMPAADLGAWRDGNIEIWDDGILVQLVPIATLLAEEDPVRH